MQTKTSQNLTWMLYNSMSIFGKKISLINFNLNDYILGKAVTMITLKN